MDELSRGLVTIATAIVGVAILALLVSTRSNTAGVLNAFGSSFANALSAATGPVTGAVSAPNVGGGGNNLSSMFNLGGMTMPGLSVS